MKENYKNMKQILALVFLTYNPELVLNFENFYLIHDYII